MKVVVDTNVLVSSLLSSKGPPRVIFRLFLARKIDWLVNDFILAEYEEVLSRKEFSLQWNEAVHALGFVRLYATHIPYIPEGMNVPDLSDLPFILCARQGKADALVTGNKRHFPSSLCQGFKLFSPMEFISHFKSK